MRYDGLNFDEVIEEHRRYTKQDYGCFDYTKADFHGADLRNRSLRGLNLQYADLSYAKLRNADLREADLSDANLCFANLDGADLTGACLCGAQLYHAELWHANLTGADLRGADFYHAVLFDTNLSGTRISYANFHNAGLQMITGSPDIPISCPDTGEFIAWAPCVQYLEPERFLERAKLKDNFLVVKLKIPADAKRTSTTYSWAIADKAVVLEIQSLDGRILKGIKAETFLNHRLIYEVGKTVEYPFPQSRFEANTSDLFFYINRKEAVAFTGHG